MSDADESISTWDYPEEKEILKRRIVDDDTIKASIGLGTVFEEMEKMQKFMDSTQADSRKASFTKRAGIDESIESLIVFTEQALERKLTNISSLKNYKVDFDSENGIIVVSYFIKGKLSIQEEREIADFEVITLERINVYRIEFRRTYL